MNASIITIGDEILIGQTLNTNAAYIGEEISNLNITISKVSVIGDDESSILNELTQTWALNDIIIVSGGLGPTHDDITLSCIAKFFNTELIKNEEILQNIKEIFAKRGRVMSEINEKQAFVPKISIPIKNYSGTAPGIWIEKDKKIFAALPGVPYEMKAMMHDFVLPKLNEKITGNGCIKRTTLLTTGIPESALFERLGNLEELLKDAKLAFLPSQYGVKMRITVSSESEETASNKISEIEQKIRSLVGRYIYGKNNDSLEAVIGRLLSERGLTIAVAESCTGGNIMNLLTNISGSSNYVERGFVTYSDGSKVELLKVDEDTLIKYGSVSLEVARQMAEGVKAVSGTDIGLVATGIMGPTGASNGKPVGLVYIGICDEKVCTAKKFLFGDNRLLNKERTTYAALEMLRRHLLGIPIED
jgi:nicotinamide-nucleotide amidase